MPREKSTYEKKAGLMIPDFDMSNVLPPFTGRDATNGSSVSPYKATMGEVVQRFGTTSQRHLILDGLLKYRWELYEAGLSSGFQWLDGSFVENIERSEGRSPNDVDVVTFFRRPVPLAQWRGWCQKNRRLFDSASMKTIYMCDTYGVDLDAEMENVVRSTAYWFGLFSHRRASKLWKGIVQVELDPVGRDASASILLKELISR